MTATTTRGSHGETRARLLDFIARYHRFHKRGPSYAQMANHLGLKSLGSVYQHLDQLHKDGLVTWADRKRGSIRPLFRPTVRNRSEGDWTGDTRTRILVYIINYHEMHGYGPSHDDIMREFGLARTTVHSHLDYMRADGLVGWEDGKDRSLRPLMRVTLAFAARGSDSD